MHRPLIQLASVAFLASLALSSITPATAQVPQSPEPLHQGLIPAGSFTMGAEGSTEMPPHRVRIAAFLMDPTEVTNASYLEFCQDTDHALPVFWGLERFRCGPDYPDHPVVGVSQSDARAYARWAGKRLPTEAEWEYAARGGLDGLRYDVADTIAGDLANYKSSGNDGTVPVGSYRPNGYGLYDMVGNVREWTADRWGVWEGDPGEVVHDPAGPTEGRWRVIKGGGWFSGGGCNSITVRNVLPGGWKDFNVGFRCARDVDPEQE